MWGRFRDRRQVVVFVGGELLALAERDVSV
jgi:hypothetical protein